MKRDIHLLRLMAWDDVISVLYRLTTKISAIPTALFVVLFVPSAVQAAGQVFPVTLFERVPILAAQMQPPASRLGQINLQSSKGEYEPASAIIRAGATPLRNVVVSVSDLVDSQSKRRISSSAIDVRLVKEWYQARDGWNSPLIGQAGGLPQRLVPELLVKDDGLVRPLHSERSNAIRMERSGRSFYLRVNDLNAMREQESIAESISNVLLDSTTLQPFDVGSNSSQRVWFTVHTPVDARAGTYVGTICFDSEEKRIGVIKVVLSVLSFELPEELVFSIYYRAKLSERVTEIGSEFKSEMQMAAELKDIVAHGIRSPTIYQRIEDTDGVRRVLLLHDQVGAQRDPLFFLGLQTTHEFLGISPAAVPGRLRELVPLFVRLGKEHGAKSVFIYGRDEAKGQELVAQHGLWEVVHQAGAKVFAAGYGDAFGLVGSQLDMLIYQGKPDAIEARRWHQAGHGILSYGNPQTGPENPFLFRLNYGLVLWANDFDGAMPYAYQHCFGSCWNDVDHPKYRDHVLAYPTSGPPIPTIAWEGLREGIDDVRYVRALERVIRGHVSQPRLAEEASAYLASLRREMMRLQAKSGPFNQNAEIDIDAVRQRVIGYILSLSGADDARAHE